MARIIIASYMFRFPQGGMMAWVFNYILGLRELGHEVFFVEKAVYADACYDPEQGVMSDDCSYAIRTVGEALNRSGMADHWCFVDSFGVYHGLSRNKVDAVFATAAVFIDMAGHGAWASEAERAGLRIMIDAEPGFNQVKMEKLLRAGASLPTYDAYFTPARNIGTPASCVPTAGVSWRPIAEPVLLKLFDYASPREGSAYTTVMSWQSFKPMVYEGIAYGQKDAEFIKFERLPELTSVPLELTVSGGKIPTDQLTACGWRVRAAESLAGSISAYRDYLSNSRGEFTVCKQAFVNTHCGWFGDREVAYLATGRPVVMQDSGWSEHYPCGEGLFAVTKVEEAAAAIDEIERDYARHSLAARAIAQEFFDSQKVLAKLLKDVGI